MSRKQGTVLAALARPAAVERERAKPRPAASEGQSWYRISNHDPAAAELFIYDEIGVWGVSASDLLNDLAQMTAATINVRINSPGGDVFDGIAIYNALLSHPAQVDVTVDSLAASAASFIAMAGDTVTMARNSQLMIHDARMMMFGSFAPADLRDITDLLDRQSDNIAAIYADAAGGDAATWRAAMQAETWYSAQEAVDAKLATAVAAKPQRAATDPPAEPAEPVAATFDPEQFRASLRLVAQQPAPFDAGKFRRALKEASK